MRARAADRRAHRRAAGRGRGGRRRGSMPGSAPICARCGAPTARAIALEPELVAALARATARAEMTWREARANADFEALAPALAEVVRLTREEAAAKAEALGLAPYDALLDGYEPGMRRAADRRAARPAGGVPAGFPGAGAGAPDGAPAARRAVPAGRADGARPQADGAAGLRLRARPARRERASVLRRRAGRHPPDRALRGGATSPRA